MYTQGHPSLAQTYMSLHTSSAGQTSIYVHPYICLREDANVWVRKCYQEMSMHADTPTWNVHTSFAVYITHVCVIIA